MALLRPGLPFLRKLAGALFAEGQYIPARPASITANGTVISPPQPEYVEPKGILRSKTVWSAIVSAVLAMANIFGWDLGFTAEQADEIYNAGSALFALLAGVFRVGAWMPTRGPTMGEPT